MVSTVVPQRLKKDYATFHMHKCTEATFKERPKTLTLIVISLRPTFYGDYTMCTFWGKIQRGRAKISPASPSRYQCYLPRLKSEN